MMASFHIHIKSGAKGQATNHAKYITREGKFKNHEKSADLVKTNFGNFPDWAEDNPTKFWSAADKCERSNGTTYREFELALPAELSTQHNTELIEKFIDAVIPGKPFQYAIHAPIASIGKTRQPHAHVMFNDRRPDEIDRLPEQYFRRFNPVNPELGGAKKDSGGKDRKSVKEDLVNIRKIWADLQNEKLEQMGLDVRVDHRSYRERGVDKVAEMHLGFGGVMALSDEELNAMNQRRGQVQSALVTS
jgi:hypothetical protein